MSAKSKCLYIKAFNMNLKFNDNTMFSYIYI